MNEYVENLRNYIKTLERHLDELRGFAPPIARVKLDDIVKDIGNPVQPGQADD